MFGRILNTLNSRLRKEEREWRSGNRILSELKPGRLHSVILTASEWPLITTCGCFAIATALVLCMALRETKFAAGKVNDAVAYFSSLWTIQAGLVALLYPIVIAFVTILLARQRSTTASLSIYFHDSAAQLAGFSALLLVIQMALQYLFIPLVEIPVVVNWLRIDLLWFLGNVLLTIYFLSRTFQFVKPARRFEITKRYLVNVVWRREARRHLATHLFRAAVAERMLPGPAFGKDTSQPSILIGFPMDAKHSYDEVLAGDRELSNVRFRVLAWAVRSWLRRATSVAVNANAGSFARVLCFPLTVGAPHKKGNVTLCSVNAIELTWRERQLVRLSFAFRRPRKDWVVDVKSVDIFSNEKAEATEALRNADLEGFREQILRLVSLYELVVLASAIKDDKGGASSLLLLQQENGFLGEKLSSDLSSQFVDLFEGAARKIGVGDEYVRSVSFIPRRLFTTAARIDVFPLMDEFIELGPILYFAIARWWNEALESEGRLRNGICRALVLRPSSRGKYERAIHRFVESWEALQVAIARSRGPTWAELSIVGRCLQRHLFHTLAMLFTTSLRGDRTGVRCLLDVLVKWHGALQPWFRDHSYEILSPRFVTSALLEDNWNEVLGQLSILATVAGTPTPAAVFAAVVKNLWRDMCCIAVFIHLYWGKRCDHAGSATALVFQTLTKGKAWLAGGATPGKPYANADELLVSILRQRYADSRYTSSLNAVIERLFDLSHRDVLSGRGYSSHGARDFDRLEDGQLLALMLAAPGNWTVAATLRDMLRGWAGTRNDQLRDFRQLLTRWSARLRHEEFAERTVQYNLLDEDNAPVFDAHRRHVSDALDALNGVLDEAHAQQLAAAVISDDRLSEIARWASTRAFSKDTAAFPISMFNAVGRLDENEAADAITNSVLISGFNRGEFTAPPLAQSALDEEWISKVVRNHAAEISLHHIIHELAPREVVVANEAEYWQQFKQYAVSARDRGLHPVLLLENPTIPRWVYDWGNRRYDPTQSVPENVEVAEKAHPGLSAYQFHLMDVPVLAARLRPSTSILLSLESLERVDFVRNADGVLARATVQADEASADAAKLKLEWRVRWQIEQMSEVLVLNYASAQRADSDE